MGDNVQIEFHGLKELQRDLKKLANTFEPDKVEKISLESAEIIRAQAQRNAPRGPTGNLKRAQVKKLLQRKGNEPAPAIAAVDRKIAPHGYIVEYGGRGGRMPPNPYFRRAINQKGDEAADNFMNGLKRLQEDMTKKTLFEAD